MGAGIQNANDPQAPLVWSAPSLPRCTRAGLCAGKSDGLSLASLDMKMLQFPSWPSSVFLSVSVSLSLSVSLCLSQVTCSGEKLPRHRVLWRSPHGGEPGPLATSPCSPAPGKPSVAPTSGEALGQKHPAKLLPDSWTSETIDITEDWDNKCLLF